MKIDREIIIKELEKRNAIKPCHRCGHEQFSVIDDYSNINMRKDVIGNIDFGGPSIPAILIACNNCGAITFHALRVLVSLKGDE